MPVRCDGPPTLPLEKHGANASRLSNPLSAKTTTAIHQNRNGRHIIFDGDDNDDDDDDADCACLRAFCVALLVAANNLNMRERRETKLK